MPINPDDFELQMLEQQVKIDRKNTILDVVVNARFNVLLAMKRAGLLKNGKN